MKRKDLLKHILAQGCRVTREGAKHTIILNESLGSWATIPRHREVNTFLAKGICKQLGIKLPSRH